MKYEVGQPMHWFFLDKGTILHQVATVVDENTLEHEGQIFPFSDVWRDSEWDALIDMQWYLKRMITLYSETVKSSTDFVLKNPESRLRSAFAHNLDEYVQSIIHKQDGLRQVEERLAEIVREETKCNTK